MSSFPQPTGDSERRTGRRVRGLLSPSCAGPGSTVWRRPRL